MGSCGAKGNFSLDQALGENDMAIYRGTYTTSLVAQLGKESAANAGDPSSYLSREDPPGEGIVTHSLFLGFPLCEA